MLAEILKRLAEMFPRQDYQSRLERYISSHYPKSTADVESVGQARAAAVLARQGRIIEAKALYLK